MLVLVNCAGLEAPKEKGHHAKHGELTGQDAVLYELLRNLAYRCCTFALPMHTSRVE